MDFQPNSLQNFLFHFQKKPTEDKQDAFLKEPSFVTLDLPNALKDPPYIHHNGPSENHSQSNIKPKRPILLPKSSASTISNQKAVIHLQEKSTNPLNRPVASLESSDKEPQQQSKKQRTVSVESKSKEGGPVTLVKAYLESGCSRAMNEDFEKALAITSQAKALIDKYLEKKWKFDYDTVFLTLYNLTVLNYNHYKRLRKLEDCAVNIKDIIINHQAMKSQKVSIKSNRTFGTLHGQAEYLDVLVSKDVYKRYECKVYLQACILFSELGDHAKAFSFARKASKLACRLLYDSLLVAYYMYLKLKEAHKTGSNSQTNPDSMLDDSDILLEMFHQKQGSINEPFHGIKKSEKEQLEYLEGIIPILEAMVEKVKGKKESTPTSNRSRLLLVQRKMREKYHLGEADMTNLYGKLPSDHFLYTWNLMAIIQLQLINPSEFKGTKSFQEVVETNSLIEQILTITVSLYCTSTELRFWNEEKQNDDSPSKRCQIMMEYQPTTSLKKESELWIGRCLAFAFVYLPHSSPLAGQIFNIHSNVYDSTKLTIPEEEEVDYQLKYLVPAKGIQKSLNFIPIIKKGLQDENEGIEPLIFLDKDHTASTRKVLDNLKLFETSDKFYELLLENYAQQKPRDPSFFHVFKKSLLKNVKTFNNLNKSFNRVSSNSPSRNDNSFQKLQRVLGANSFFKASDNDQSYNNESIVKESSDFDLRVATEPEPAPDNTQPVLKEISTHLELKPSLNKLRHKLQMGAEDIRKSLKGVMKSKDNMKPPEFPIKALSSSKVYRKPASTEGHGGSTGNNSFVQEKPMELEVKGERTADNKSYSTVKGASNSGNALPRTTVKSSLEKLVQKHSLGQLLSDLGERKNFKPLRASVEGNMKTFFRKNGIKREGSHSPETKKQQQVLNVSVDAAREGEAQKSRQKIGKPPLVRSSKEEIRSVVKMAVRPASSLKVRSKLDENTKVGDNSFSGEGNKTVDDINTSSILVSREALKQNETIGNLRSTSVGRRDAKYKQRIAMLKKIPEIN